MKDQLNTVVAIRTGIGKFGDSPELALVLSACDAPTFGMRKPSGEWVNWRQDLTRPATPEETVRYWESRARHAEQALEAEKRELCR